MNKPAELLPCPFCGGKARMQHASDVGLRIIQCQNLECPASLLIVDEEKRAIKAWNTRAASPSLPVPGDEEAARKVEEELGIIGEEYEVKLLADAFKHHREAHNAQAMQVIAELVAASTMLTERIKHENEDVGLMKGLVDAAESALATARAFTQTK